MGDRQDVTYVESARVRCAGEPAKPHPQVELVLSRGASTVCPVCGRRFRRIQSRDTLEPAVWPGEE